MKITKINSNPSRFLSNRGSLFDKFWELSSMMDDWFLNNITGSQLVSNMNMDMWEEEGVIYVKLAIPGIKKEDIHIEIEENYLYVKVSTKSEEELEEKRKYYHRSIVNHFENTIKLPEKVDPDQSEARYEDGILTIKLPKQSTGKVKKIDLK